MENVKHLVVVDGMSFFFRAYHAVRGNLSKTDGTPTNALFGFAQMLVKVVDTLNPDLCCVALDSKEKTFRSAIYPAYKANRPPPEENMVKQFPYFIPMIQSFGIPALGVEGVEADDIIATLVARQRAAFGVAAKVTIVSSDKDLMQLLGGDVRMLDTLKDTSFGPEEVVGKFGVGPDKVIEVQALIGDSSDNVPGVRGIGPKTAAELVQRFENLDGIYAHLEEIEREKLRESLRENKELAYVSRTLVTLKPDVVLPEVDMTFHPHLHEAAEYLQNELEFNTLANRLLKRRQNGILAASGAERALEGTEKSPFVGQLDAGTDVGSGDVGSGHGGAGVRWGGYDCVTSDNQWRDWLAEVRRRGVVAFDTETTSLDPYVARLVGISLAVAPGRACYVPVKEQGTRNKVQEGAEQGDLFGEPAAPVGPHGVAGLDILDDVAALLADVSVKKIGHNLKYDWLVVARALGVIPDDTGVGLQGLLANYEDTLLMSACLDGGRWGHGLDDSALRHLGHAMIPFSAVCGKGKAMVTFDAVPLDKATEYAAEDADATFRLWEIFRRRLENHQEQETRHAAQGREGGAEQGEHGFGVGYVYEHIEKPLLPVIVALEARGVAVDVPALRELSADFALRLSVLEREIWNLSGREFNVQSTQQLAVVLFDDMGLGSDKQRKSRSTSVDVLEDLAEGDGPGARIAQLMVQYRQLAKLRSTYAEALVQQVNPVTGRVHTSYQQIGAATGRFSSSDPNLQNIPIRTEEGRKIRHAFVPKAGTRNEEHGTRDAPWVMVSADYSQIELRLLAHLSGSEALRTAFTEGLDIHAYTASLIHGVDIQDVSKDQRRAAKVINFGLVYGMGARSMAAGIGSTVSEAQAWIDAYFRRYEGVREYMDLNKRTARENGYVETLFGRRVWLPEIASSNGGLRAGAERAAINAPLQGSNADIIKLAMGAVEQRLWHLGTRNEEHGTRAPNVRLLMQVHDELVLECAPDVVDDVKVLLPEVMGGVVRLAVPLAVEVGVGPNWEAAH